MLDNIKWYIIHVVGIELTYLTADHLLPGHKEFWDDRNIFYVVVEVDIWELCICQSTSECLLEMVTFYVYYTLIRNWFLKFHDIVMILKKGRKRLTGGD